jgi:hypothetical protein
MRFGVMAVMAILAGAAWAQEWEPLVNGSSLDGWTKRGGNATFELKGNEIVGRTGTAKENTFLCTDKTYGDFEL